MELKFAKIQWKKVLAFVLTFCMTITMVQLPVNAEETTETKAPKHFNLWGLEKYEQTATFFDAAEDRDAIGVTTIEQGKAYTVDPTKGYYDAKWFSFTPAEDSLYTFKGRDIGDSRVDSYGVLMEKDGANYRYITYNDDGDGSHFSINTVLQKGKTYYLCAGYYYSEDNEEYSVQVYKRNIETFDENKGITFLSTDTPKSYSLKVADSGYYNLDFTWDSDKNEYENVDFGIINKDGEKVNSLYNIWSSSGIEGIRTTYKLDKDQIYYLNVDSFELFDKDSYDKVSENVTAHISKISEEKITEGQPGKLKANSKSKIFRFTANDTGWYKLKYSLTGQDDSKICVNDFYVKAEENNQTVETIEASFGREYFIYLEKDKAYFLSQHTFGTYSNEEEDASVLISKAEQSDVSDSKTAIVTSGELGRIFTFVPDKSGYYRIEAFWDNKDADISGQYSIYREYEEDGITYFDDVESAGLDDAVSFNAKKGQTYYLVVGNPSLSMSSGDGEVLKDKISIKISDIENAMDTITSEKPGEYIKKPNTHTAAKLYKYVATNTGYYKLSFDWDKSLTANMYMEANVQVKDSDYDTFERIDDLEKSKSLYLEQGKTYYIEVYYISLETDEDENTPVTFKINISPIPAEELNYNETTNIKTQSVEKLFKFTAQQDGYHVLTAKWKNADVKMTAWGEIRTLDGASVSNDKIAKESDTYYRSFNCKKGETYYINLLGMKFASLTTGKTVDSVDVEVSVSYYNGATDLDTIKNTQPWTPGQDSGNTDKPDNGNTDKPDNGNTDKPDNGNTDKPDNGNTDKPDNGNTDKPDSGNTDKPDSGNTDKPDNGNTDKPDSGNTDKPDSGNTDKPDNGNTDKPDSGNTDKPNNGNTSKPDNGNTNKPNASTEKKDTGKTNKPATSKPATIKVSKIKISAISNKIAAGKKVKLTATVAPANASNKAVKWTSSNKKVAVVSNNGAVTVNKKAGGKSVVITAIAADGKGARTTYKIKVMKDAVKKVTITGKNIVKAGKTLKLKAKVTAGKKANKKLIWSSNNTKFATVNQTGVVKTTKAGKGKKVKITATATDGSNKKKVFTIKIK